MQGRDHAAAAGASHDQVAAALGVFISYSNHDGAAVRALKEDLADAGYLVWLDQDLKGGDAWWRAILEQIRNCSVFVVAVSANTLRSKPCQAELGYARDLAIPVLPVQIGEIGSMRTTDIFELQVVDYRQATPRAGIRLTKAVDQCAQRRRALPDPLPPPPLIPYEYLARIGIAAAGSQLSSNDQTAAIGELRAALDQEDDEEVRGEIVALLRVLHGRGDVTVRSVQEIEMLLALVELRASKDPVDEPPSSEPAAPGPPRSGLSGNWLSLVAMVLALVAVLCYPVLVGSAAFVLAVVAHQRGEPVARLAVVVALCGTLAGSYLGVLLEGSL